MTIIQKLHAKRSKKGFTLVELVIVIAILAILAAIAIPVVASVIASANTNADKSDAATIDLACKSYNTQVEAKIITDDSPTVGEALTESGLPASILTGKTGSYYFDANKKVVPEGEKEDGATALTTATALPY